jgi:hypothetical protein
MTFFSTESAHQRIAAIFKETKANVDVRYEVFEDWGDFLILSREVSSDDLFVIVSARAGSLSFDGVMQQIPKMLSKHFQQQNFVLVYPEQQSVVNLVPLISAIPAY